MSRSRRTTIPLATPEDTVSGRQTTLKHRTQPSQYGWIYALRSCRAREVSTTEYGLIAAAAVVAVAVLVEVLISCWLALLLVVVVVRGVTLFAVESKNEFKDNERGCTACPFPFLSFAAPWLPPLLNLPTTAQHQHLPHPTQHPTWTALNLQQPRQLNGNRKPTLWATSM